MLLSLANEIGLITRRVASTHGGEYHSPCPNCGGRDRFIIWNATDRYFCRRCQKKGDAIQFCRDFMNLDFPSACAKANRTPTQIEYENKYRHNLWEPKIAPLPSLIWKNKAREFVLASHLSLMANKQALQSLFDRGLTKCTIRKTILGWNPWNQSLARTDWDLPKKEGQTGQPTNLWLPSGIVIPTQLNGEVIKIKIRRKEWQQKDELPKYYEISGSTKCPSWFGEKKSVVVIVNAFRFWKETYPQAKAWPVPKEKSPGDAFKAKVDLRKWLVEGLKYYKMEIS